MFIYQTGVQQFISALLPKGRSDRKTTTQLGSQRQNGQMLSDSNSSKKQRRHANLYEILYLHWLEK